MNNKNKFKSWWIIGLIVPFIGLIIYYCNKNMDKDTKSNLMTGTIIGFGLWLFIALSFLISVNGPEPVESKEYLVSEWLVDAEGEEPVVTIMGMTTCGYCQQYKPVIESLAEEYGFKLYFFETDALSSEDAYIVESTYELDEFQNQVPFTFIVQDGEVISQNTGYKDQNEVVKFLTQNGVIK